MKNGVLTNDRIKGGEALERSKLEQQVLVNRTSAYIIIQAKHPYDEGNLDDEEEDDEEEEEEEDEEGFIKITMYELKIGDNKLILEKVKEEKIHQETFMGHYVFVACDDDVYALMVSRCDPGVMGSTVQVISVKLFYSGKDCPEHNDEVINWNGELPPSGIPLSLRDEKSMVVPSAENGKLYQLRSVCPLVTELWAFDVKARNWSPVKPPPLQVVPDFEEARITRLNTFMLEYLDAACFLHPETDTCFERQRFLRVGEKRRNRLGNTECVDCKISSFQREESDGESDDESMSSTSFILYAMALNLL